MLTKGSVSSSSSIPPTLSWLENETSLMAKRTRITKNLKRSELALPFSPHWDVANNSKCANPLVAKELVLFGSTPADIAGAQSLQDEEFSHRIMVNQAEHSNLLADLYARWICTKNKLLSAEPSSLENQNQLLLARARKAEANAKRAEIDMESLEKKHSSQIFQLELLAKNSREEVATLSKENFVLKTNENLHLKNLSDRNVLIEDLQAKLSQANALTSSLQAELAKANACHMDLQAGKASAEAQACKLREERTWLLTAGVKYIIDYVHKNSPIVDAISKINEAIKTWSFSEGVKAGYQHGIRGNSTVNTVPGFKADGEPAYNQALEEYDMISFDLADDLEVAAEEPLDTIKQILIKFHTSSSSPPK